MALAQERTAQRLQDLDLFDQSIATTVLATTTAAAAE